MAYEYRRNFKAPQTAGATAATTKSSGRDRRDGAVYVWNEELELAVNIAIATERPLLVRGPSGTGKSSFAASLAVAKKWRYYEHVVSSTTEAQHLLWRFETLQRLSDAQASAVRPSIHYVTPGALWWAFDPRSAERRGVDDAALEPLPDPNRFPAADDARAVVLIDEIDKADPDVPNNLLVPLGSLEFTVSDVAVAVKATVPPIVIITTNEERELPNAFTRRCVVVKLEPPDRNRLLRIADAHFGKERDHMYEKVADALDVIATNKKSRGLSVPSTAEYLDAIATCRDLGVTPGSNATWRAIERAIFLKPSMQDESRDA